MDLDFPEIVAPAEQPAQAPAAAPAQPAAVAAELVDRADVRDGTVLVTYSRTEAALAGLRERFTGAKFDLTTTKGDKAARSARQELVTLRTALEKKRLELKRPAIEFGKKIDAEAARITTEITALEAPIDAQIKADEKRREEEAAERKRIDDARKANHQANIAKIDAMLVGAEDKSAERLAKGVQLVDGLLIEGFEEFQAEAEETRVRVLLKLKDLHSKAAAREAAAAEAQRVADENAARALTVAQLGTIADTVTACFGKSVAEIELHVEMLKATTYPDGVDASVLAAHEKALVQMDQVLGVARAQEKHRDEVVQQQAAAAAPAPEPVPEPLVVPLPAVDVATLSSVSMVDESPQCVGHSRLPVGGPAWIGVDPGIEMALETSEAEARVVPSSLVQEVLANSLPAHRVEALGDLLLMDEVRSFVDYALQLRRDSKFPNHPKPGPDWFAGLFSRAESLLQQIGGAA